jgi:VanZ family protein
MMSGQHTGHMLLKFFAFFHLGYPAPWVWTLNLVLRKTGHFFGYAMVSLLLFRGYRNHLRWRHGLSPKAMWSDGWDWCWRAQWSVLAVMFTFLIATADELHQMTIPSRTGSWHDVVLDTTGAIISQFLLWKWIAWRREAATS